jgi:hypothetical protein
MNENDEYLYAGSGRRIFWGIVGLILTYGCVIAGIVAFIAYAPWPR